jgi:hypothetical protein
MGCSVRADRHAKPRSLPENCDSRVFRLDACHRATGITRQPLRDLRQHDPSAYAALR